MERKQKTLDFSILSGYRVPARSFWKGYRLGEQIKAKGHTVFGSSLPLSPKLDSRISFCIGREAL